MAKATTQILTGNDRILDWAEQAVIVIVASLFIAVCAQISIPLPGTPVPLTLQNFGVILIGLTLGSRRGFAAMALYLMEGASGLPVFSPATAGGMAALTGFSGGYLMTYPLVAGLAGWIMERGKASFARAAVAGGLGEIVLFAGGLGWLFVLTHSFKTAIQFGLYWFVFAEVIKVLLAAGIARGWKQINTTLP